MKSTEIAFVKRLDDSHERILASGQQATKPLNERIAIRTFNCASEISTINGKWRLYRLSQSDSNDKTVKLIEDINQVISLRLLCNNRQYTKTLRVNNQKGVFYASAYPNNRLGLFRYLPNGNLEILEVEQISKMISAQTPAKASPKLQTEKHNITYSNNDNATSASLSINLNSMTRNPNKFSKLQAQQITGHGRVFIQDGKISEIEEISLTTETGLRFELPSIRVSYTGYFSSAESNDPSNLDNYDSGFISFDGNSKTFVLVLSTGYFEGGSFIFSEENNEYVEENLATDESLVDQESENAEQANQIKVINLEDESSARAQSNNVNDVILDQDAQREIAETSGYQFQPSNEINE